MTLNRTIIIAEAGVNHNGDLTIAKKLVEAAAIAGADIVKFQTFNASRQVTKTAMKADYQQKTTNSIESQHEMLSRLELSDTMHYALIEHCKKFNIKFLSTGFDIESVDFLVGLGQDQFKIPSGEITNFPYLQYIGGLKKNVFISTGMCTLKEIDDAIQVLEKAGTKRSMMTVLQCTTAYPAPMSEVNLRAMDTIQKAFGVKIGYSDHTSGIEAAIAAVALGAEVVEKHFTLNRNLPGPDHLASLEPAELKSMVLAIRNIECALGDGFKVPSPSETTNMSVVRKSIVAKTIIKMGDVFTVNNLAVKRPGYGLSPMLWKEVLGKKAIRDFNIDELINL